jgi:prolyl-tRNA synthetase
VVVPVLFGRNDEAVLVRCREALSALAGLRVKLDDDPKQTAGWKYNQYEMLGVPVRVEIGPRDVEKQAAVLVPRDGSGKRVIRFVDLRSEVERLLEKVQRKLYESALTRMQAMMAEAGDFDGFRRKLSESPGFIRVFWCGRQECENRIIDGTKTTPRVMVLDEQEKATGPCIACGAQTAKRIHYARTY